jgi:putative ABC transport system ATP-binding protein
MAPLLEARSLSRTFSDGRIQALTNVAFAVEPGEFIAIQGPSGCGKSTLLHILGGLDQPTSGEVRFQARPLDEIGEIAAFRSRSVGFVFQASHLLPTLSAVENVEVPMFEMPWSKRERRRRAIALLDAVGLHDRMNEAPFHLSGGERQRVALARALANEPPILLADEPTGSLDSSNADRIMALLGQIHAERGTTVVVVTHDPVVASRAGRRLALLDGHLVGDSRA